jgi:7-cyano-7-deazaguanine synthase
LTPFPLISRVARLAEILAWKAQARNSKTSLLDMERAQRTSMYDSICTLSGGVDTTTLAYHLVRIERRRPLFVFVDYRHKACVQELRCAEATASTLDCDLFILPFETYPILSESYIFDRGAQFETGSQFWLEGRNVLIALFLAVIASKHRVREIYMGSHKPLAGWEHEGYPDSTAASYDAINTLIETAYKWHAKVLNPFIDWDWDKAQIVKHGQSLGVRWEDTFTCCEAGKLHCGSCEACEDRKQAFMMCRLSDPCFEGTALADVVAASRVRT